jgi:hypothetical protein
VADKARPDQLDLKALLARLLQVPRGLLDLQAAKVLLEVPDLLVRKDLQVLQDPQEVPALLVRKDLLVFQAVPVVPVLRGRLVRLDHQDRKVAPVQLALLEQVPDLLVRLVQLVRKVQEVYQAVRFANNILIED